MTVERAPGDAADPPPWTVLVIGAADYAARLASFRGDPEPRAEDLADYWRSDFSSERLAGGVDHSAVRHGLPFEGLTLFDGPHRTLIYLLPEAAPLFTPHLEHLVGHVLRFERWAAGYVDVHAAFVRYLGKGLALIGPKRAGKTSLAMHLVSRGAEMLGSDMAQIRWGEGGIVAASIPHMCRITRETVLDNSWLREAIGAADDDNRDYLAGPLFSHGKYELYDPSLERVFQRQVDISAMNLDAIVFPHFSLETGRSEGAPIAPEACAQRLVRSFRTDRPLADWLAFDLTARGRAEADLERRLAQAGPAVPGFDLRFGREPSMRWREIDALVDTL